jgi:uncharacterized protein YodC (DUF2158 family)
MEFKNGDVVRLKSGGPDMTIAYAHPGGMIDVMWFVEGKMHSANVHPDVIGFVTPRKPENPIDSLLFGRFMLKSQKSKGFVAAIDSMIQGGRSKCYRRGESDLFYRVRDGFFQGIAGSDGIWADSASTVTKMLNESFAEYEDTRPEEP